MENPTPVNSSESNIGGSTFDQQRVSPTNKANLALTIIIAFLVSGVIFGLGGYYIGSKFKHTGPTQQVAPTPTSEGISKTIIPSPSYTETTNKIIFSEALSNFCLNNKINLDKLPFILNQTIKTSYNVQDSISCFVPDQNYATMSIQIENSEFSGDIRNVYFFHQNSKYIGMGDPFQSLGEYKTVIINGHNYWLNIREPGPYGISSLGVWIDLIGEKRDTNSGTIVRVINLDILKDQQSEDLVKKYGTQISTADGQPIYVVNSAQKMQFIEEIVKLAPQNSALNLSAQSINSDLEGVSF